MGRAGKRRSPRGRLLGAAVARLPRRLTLDLARRPQELLGLADGSARLAELLVIGDVGVVRLRPRDAGGVASFGGLGDVAGDPVEAPLQREGERVGIVEERS